MCGGERGLRIYFLSDGRDRGVSRGSGRAYCGKKSEREQGREMAYKKVQVLAKMLSHQLPPGTPAYYAGELEHQNSLLLMLAVF